MADTPSVMDSGLPMADDDGLFAEESAIPPSTFDPTEVFDDSASDAPGTRVGTAAFEPRFDGDTSQLPPQVCWALQELVAAPHVSGKDSKHWAVLLQHEKQLRSRLSELGLLLEINHEHRYAFTRQADDPSPHSRAILRTKTLSLAASTLTLYLYQQYLASPESPVVESTDMIDYMMAYKRGDDTDEASFQKKVAAAIKSLDDAAIIKPVKGTDRYVIHGVITSILTADRVEALTQRYRAIARGEAVPEGGDGVETEEPAAEGIDL
ncbi:DUF4194 domain-containing protein [Phytoactinopolyspora alkaliphila]|uniref:DUF4194 domain-containing protein n=1 Tax=Phytoactinopolyspora alkaliphila TaxID=1783498 RepID=A0A6N9YKW3_9ACTN|nr:DUF4194 domain-containing protein [Phytoactinopolyspora alkaliphila]NED95560.1 DUF4194 domain-containing protein [Phytoactinopolyspora alkaliphila]